MPELYTETAALHNTAAQARPVSCRALSYLQTAPWTLSGRRGGDKTFKQDDVLRMAGTAIRSQTWQTDNGTPPAPRKASILLTEKLLTPIDLTIPCMSRSFCQHGVSHMVVQVFRNIWIHGHHWHHECSRRLESTCTRLLQV